MLLTHWRAEPYDVLLKPVDAVIAGVSPRQLYDYWQKRDHYKGSLVVIPVDAVIPVMWTVKTVKTVIF